ncbi:MAG: inositol monophosphatase family protein [Acidobacteriota bacterium]
MKELAAAIEAALAGGQVLKRWLGGAFEVSYKGELDLVTQADTESEKTIVSLLSKRLPGVTILAEEGGMSEGDPNRRYIVDPLDGTTNFSHGYPFFAVSIAYERAGEIEAGVVYDPLREELFTGERGAGSFLNGRRLHASEGRRLDRALLITGFPYDLKEDLSGNLRLFNRFMGEARAIRRDGSAALDLCYVAAGRVDAFWEEKLGPWDTAAGSLLVTEAGGRVSDFSGRSFDCYGKQILASNGLLHDSMLRVLGRG